MSLTFPPAPSALQPRDDIYGPYDRSYLGSAHGGPKQATLHPTVTGTSVVALKFSDGVVIAADNLGKNRQTRRRTKVDTQRGRDLRRG